MILLLHFTEFCLKNPTASELLRYQIKDDHKGEHLKQYSKMCYFSF